MKSDYVELSPGNRVMCLAVNNGAGARILLNVAQGNRGDGRLLPQVSGQSVLPEVACQDEGREVAMPTLCDTEAIVTLPDTRVWCARRGDTTCLRIASWSLVPYCTQGSTPCAHHSSCERVACALYRPGH